MRPRRYAPPLQIGPWYDTEKFQTSSAQRKKEFILLDDDYSNHDGKSTAYRCFKN